MIWPHAFDMRQWGTYMKTKDGTGIGSYTCSNEIDGSNRKYPTGIGTFVHEFGHVLGFMDHYDTANSYATYTPGYWDTMHRVLTTTVATHLLSTRHSNAPSWDG